MLALDPTPETWAVVKDLTGWGAFLLTIVWGGRAFLSIARDFSAGTLSELRQIRDAIAGQQLAVSKMDSEAHDHRERVLERLDRIEERLPKSDVR